MVMTYSEMLPLGTAAPQFELADADGVVHSLASAKGREATLVMFICNHCPFVMHIRDELAALGRDYAADRVAIYAINSNDVEAYPQDGPDAMRREARDMGYRFPYLLDADQSIAKAYRAACTPDFFVFDGDGGLAYRGQLDDSRPGNGKPVTGRDLRAALDAVLAGQPVAAAQTPSVGCNIKWRVGNEPEYFA